MTELKAAIRKAALEVLGGDLDQDLGPFDFKAESNQVGITGEEGEFKDFLETYLAEYTGDERDDWRMAEYLALVANPKNVLALLEETRWRPMSEGLPDNPKGPVLFAQLESDGQIARCILDREPTGWSPTHWRPVA